MPVLPDGCRVGFSRLRDFNSNVFNTLDTIRLVFAMYDICINEDPLAPEWKLVMDMTGFSMGHLTKLTNLTLMKKCLTYVEVNILSYHSLVTTITCCIGRILGIPIIYSVSGELITGKISHLQVNRSPNKNVF